MIQRTKRNSSLRILQSGHLQGSGCDWCWTLGNSEGTFILVADSAAKRVKSSHHTEVKKPSQVMDVTFPPCPVVRLPFYPFIPCVVYFSNTEQALLQKNTLYHCFPDAQIQKSSQQPFLPWGNNNDGSFTHANIFCVTL